MPPNRFSLPKEADIIDLRLDLAKRLPAYMIPAHFVGLEKMPLTFNGKLNKDALPAAHVQSLETYHAPQNEKQALLCRIVISHPSAARRADTCSAFMESPPS